MNANEILKLDGDTKAKCLESLTWDFFKQQKELSDEKATEFYEVIKKRWDQSENRIKEVENRCLALEFEDNSMEEGRQEILGELIDKACQAFEIYDEHQNRKIPLGHRLVLEARLLEMVNNSFDLVNKICYNFEELRGNRDGIINERDVRIFVISSFFSSGSELKFASETCFWLRFMKNFCCLIWRWAGECLLIIDNK